VKNLSALVAAAALLLAACGGGGGGDGAKVSKIDNGFSVEGGIAQKGPMAAGSRVSIDELISSTFASAGASYNLQTTGDLGNFDTSALRLSRQYIKTYVSGYYRNEITGLLANDQVTLMAYSDLDADRLVNVNLLTTLAGPRIEKLVQDKTSTSTYRKFSAARLQAQKEVLAAFRIYNSTDLMPGGVDSTKNIVPGNFNELDLSKTQTGSQILAALSAVAVQAGTNGAGISEFIADFQADLAADGLIDQTAVRSQIDTASDTINMAVVASKLKTFFPTTTVTAALLRPWVDSSGGVDLVIDNYKSTASGTSGTETQSAAYAAGVDDVGQCFSASAGKLYKGTSATFTPATANLVTGTVKVSAGNFFKIGLTGATGQTSGFMQRSPQVTTGSGTSSVTACPTVVPTTNVTRVAMYSRTSDLTTQANLVAAAASTSLSTSGTTTLSTTGGSGDGAVTYAVASGSCTISGTTLTAPSTAGTCTVTATKAATSVYSAATSAAITITISASTSTYTFANGLNTGGVTATGGTWGYYGGGTSNPQPGFAAGAFLNGTGDQLAATAAATYVGYYQNLTAADISGYSYSGNFVTYSSATGLTTTGATSLTYGVAINSEWFANTAGAKFVVLLASVVPGVSTATCNPSVAAVVNATSVAMATYTTPFTSFTKVTQDCGSGSVTAATILASPVARLDFQIDGGGAAIVASGLTSNSNSAVFSGGSTPGGGTSPYLPVALIINGVIQFK